MESFLLKGEVDIDDVQRLYNGLYLEVFTAFEGLLEDLFWGLLLEQLVPVSSDISLKIASGTGSTVREIMLMGRHFLDWLPYADNTLKRANICFRDGRPFSCLSTQEQHNLARYHRIRNAIAHQSDYAQAKFCDEVIGSSMVTPREKTPSGYLRGVFRSHPVQQRRYEAIVDELKVNARKLCQ